MKISTLVLPGLIAGLALGATPNFAGAADTTLKFGAFGSGKAPFHTRGIVPWTAKVGETSGGKIAVKVFFNTLGGPTELYKNTKVGIADIAWVVASASRGFKFPRSEVLSLPGVLDGYTNAHANRALWRLYEKGLIKEDFTDVVPLAFASMSPTHIITKDKEPSLKQLAGLKIAATSGLSAQVVKQLGGIPVFTPVTNLYQAISRKTVDGILVGFTAIQGFRLDEVTNRHVVVPLNAPLAFVGMNKAKLESLPEAAQKAILNTSGIQLATTLGRAGDGMVSFTRKRLSKNPDQKIIDVPSAERAKWRAKVQPVIDRWIKSTPNGAAILAAFKQELEAAKQGK